MLPPWGVDPTRRLVFRQFVLPARPVCANDPEVPASPPNGRATANDHCSRPKHPIPIVMGWLVSPERILKPGGARVIFLITGAIAFFATEFGRRVYRPFVRREGIDDFGLADSIGNLGGIVVQIFLSLAALNSSRKQTYRLAFFFAAGYIAYEFLQPVLPRGVFDWKDIGGTVAGLCFSLGFLWVLWRWVLPEDEDTDPREPDGAAHG